MIGACRPPAAGKHAQSAEFVNRRLCSQVRRQSRRLPAEFPRCRPLRRDTSYFGPTSAGAERMPRLSCGRSRLACPANVHASLRLCRWLLSVASDFASPSTAWERGSRRKRAATTRPHAGIGRALTWAGPAVRAERNRRIRHILDGQSAPRDAHTRDSRHRAASAGLFAPAGEPASRGSLRVMHMGCVCAAVAALPQTWKAAASGVCVRCHLHRDIVRSDRGHSPEWRPLAAGRNFKFNFK